MSKDVVKHLQDQLRLKEKHVKELKKNLKTAEKAGATVAIGLCLERLKTAHQEVADARQRLDTAKNEVNKRK